MIFASTSPKEIGCTFVDWSLLYLTGKTSFYNVKYNQWLPLVDDPLTQLNAHGHKKNHPGGLEKTKECINELLQQHADTSFYPTYMPPLEAANRLGIPITDFNSPKQWKTISDYYNCDYQQTLNHIINSGVKLIHFDVPNDVNLLFNISIRSNDYTISEEPTSKQYTLDEIKSDFQKTFFRDSMHVWNQQNLINIWDERERLALCQLPFRRSHIQFSSTKEYLHFDCRSLWIYPEQTLLECIDFIGLTLVQERLDQWRTVAQKWQQKWQHNFNFILNYQKIVDHIICGNWMKIDLTFDQEIVIQHCLIYQHNLNLKTWQLEKFPSNTQDLHKLLEPNIHTVPKIY